jgi:hypothetical protein
MRFKIYLSLIVLLAVTGTLLAPAGYAYHPTRNAERSFDIERYPNEPLELLDLKIEDQSVKAGIKVKQRRNGAGLDTVTFEGENGWFKKINVRLRNVSGKTIYGISAYLYFMPPGVRQLFRLPLMSSPGVNLRAPLIAGEEIELVIDDKKFDRSMEIFRTNGVDADEMNAFLAIESASYSNEIKWDRGQILQQAPDNPLRWNVVKPD